MLIFFKKKYDIKKHRITFDEVETLQENVEKEYGKTAELFGESPSLVTPEQFFESLIQFITSVQHAVKEIDETALKEEKARKRAEEEEAKRLLKEAKQAKKEEKAKAFSQSTTPKVEAEDEERIMDNALEKLRGGEVFSEKRKERRQSMFA